MKKYLSILIVLTMVMSIFTVMSVTVRASVVNTADTGDFLELKTGDVVTVYTDDSGNQSYLKFLPNKDMTIVFLATSDEWINGYLYDYNMVLLAEDYGFSSSRNCKITYNVTAGNTYYFGVKYHYGKAGPIDVTLTGQTIWEYMKYNENSIRIIGCNIIPESGVVEIPAYIEGNRVASINGTGDCFTWDPNQSIFGEKGDEVQEVILPDTLVKIYNLAFADCKNLKKISIPDSVIELGTDSFRSCTSLERIYIPDSVAFIGLNTFASCTKLESVRLPENLKMIGLQSFLDCSSLKSIDIPNSVSSIGELVFCDCKNLKSVTIPDSVTSIGGRAFGYCHDEKRNIARIDDFTIMGYSDTAAETYAKENNFTFIALDDEPETILGDTDGDNKVTILDATAIQRHLASMLTESFDETASDVDKDGEVTILNATAIQRHLASIPTQAQGIGKPI